MEQGYSALLLLLGYFFILLGLSFLKRIYFKGRILYLFRVFFPSWRFFEDSGTVSKLFVRTGVSETNLGPWHLSLSLPKRTLSALFLNPYGNYLHACGNLIHQLVRDIEELDENKTQEFEKSVTYQLIKSLALYQLRKEPLLNQTYYQFKVAATEPGLESQPPEDILISSIYEVNKR